jgi:hypothetical protein
MKPNLISRKKAQKAQKKMILVFINKGRVEANGFVPSALFCGHDLK